MSNHNLTIKAGPKALARIRKEGFNPELFDAMAGASGGPKWFVLSGLDKVLLGDIFARRKRPLHLLGTSAGSWRFACYGMENPLAAHKRFEEAYLHSTYSRKPTPQEVSEQCSDMLDYVLGADGPQQIVSNRLRCLNLIAVRCRGLTAFEPRSVQLAGIGLSASANLISRKLLGGFYIRTVFDHPVSVSGINPFARLNDLPTARVNLSKENVRSALMASGSIPLVLAGVKHIPGAPAGVYRDGGVTDYHFDLPMNRQGSGLVLYPHFYSRMVPGWFDKSLKWRRPSAANLDNLVLIAPSNNFVEKLPHGKIPDRNDFSNFPDADRISYWQHVVNRSDDLGEELLQLIQSGRIIDRLEPF